MFPIVFQEIIVKVPLNQLPWLYDMVNSTTTAEFFEKAFFEIRNLNNWKNKLFRFIQLFLWSFGKS